MIECYYKWCKYHPQDEPFCGEQECHITEDAAKAFGELRTLELAGNLYKPTDDDNHD